MKSVGLVLLMAGTLLAGCTGQNAGDVITGEEQIDKGNFAFAVGVGGIAGLLVDDRFRPIDLEDKSAEGEFQSIGFILVQESGKQFRTNENGEFTIVDLEPGSYTLRTSAEGHEAIPQRVTVRAGEFAETSIVARRISSAGGSIITTEFSAFIPCTAHHFSYSRNVDCTADESGDSFRFDVNPDFTIYPTLSWVVIEMKTSQMAKQGSAFDITVRNGLDNQYTSGVTFDSDYIRVNIIPGELSPDEPPRGASKTEWPNERPVQIALFSRGNYAQEVQNTYEPVYQVTKDLPLQDLSTPMRRGVGMTMGVRGQFMLSAFIGEPESSPLEYCVLC